MGKFTLDTFQKVRDKARVSISILMEENTRENGKITFEKVLELLKIQTVLSLKAIGNMIIDKVKGSIFFQTELQENACG